MRKASMIHLGVRDGSLRSHGMGPSLPPDEVVAANGKTRCLTGTHWIPSEKVASRLW